MNACARIDKKNLFPFANACARNGRTKENVTNPRLKISLNTFTVGNYKKDIISLRPLYLFSRLTGKFI